jgi:hypothetical protein
MAGSAECGSSCPSSNIRPRTTHTRFTQPDFNWFKFMAYYQKHKKLTQGFIADGTARITESSSSMVTDAAGMEDQSDEDSGKFMILKKINLKKIFSPLSIISAHNPKHIIIEIRRYADAMSDSESSAPSKGSSDDQHDADFQPPQAKRSKFNQSSASGNSKGKFSTATKLRV